ncbi:hypothetical protein [Streptomyces sp. NPDC088727]|uniref:hypothetical protein n=1 Tax=Streptomyces sp. NPDC088727 TaxID=3365875 RepID=UPI00382C8192
MDINSLMWDGATRDQDAENSELARTAALLDADRSLGPLVFQAVDSVDLGHRLALVKEHLEAISSLRGYPCEDLEADLKRRWQLLAEVRNTKAVQESERAVVSRRVTAAQEEVMDQAVVHLTAMAARENPLVPMSECLRLATEAVQKHADAFPLAYESWGGTGDGPITDRAKHWKPPRMPGSGAAATLPGTGGTGEGGSATGGNADPNMFDEVHRRLDDAESRLNSVSSPSGPTSPTASLDAMAAGFMDRVKNWWSGNGSGHQHPPTPSAAPAATHLPAETEPPDHSAHPDAAHSGWVGPYDPTGWHGGAPRRHAEDAADLATERHHDDAGRREHDEIMRRLNNDHDEMRHKFDTPAADRFEGPKTHRENADRLQESNDSRMDNMERRVNEAGAPGYDSAPIQHSLFS